MRLTQICLRQHIGRMIKRHWVVQGKKVPVENGSVAEMEKLGIPIQDACEFIFGKPHKLVEVPKDLSGVPNVPRRSNLNCQTEFLIEGLEQAGAITRAAIVDELPKNIQNVVETAKVPRSYHEAIEKTVLRDNLFEFRPHKDPYKPMLLAKLIDSSERLAGPKTSAHKKVSRNAYFALPVQKNGKTLSFETTVDYLVSTAQKAATMIPMRDGDSNGILEVPSIHPLAFDASLFTNTADIELTYPLRTLAGDKPQIQPQLIVQRCSDADLVTYHETPATESQIKSRALMSAFVVAAATAVHNYGANVKRLPKPIAIQSVLNAGSAFYFGVFLLNTLDLTTDPDSGAGGLKNVWYHVPNPVHMYLNESSDDGDSVSSMAVTSPSPIRVRDYNETVLRYLFAFYSQ